MKKLVSLVVLAALPLGGSLLGNEGGGASAVEPVAPAKGGFVLPSDYSPSLYAVEEVKQLPNGARVMVRGRIIQHLEGDRYLWAGAVPTLETVRGVRIRLEAENRVDLNYDGKSISGTIKPSRANRADAIIAIQVASNIWQGQVITPQDEFYIEGVVRKDDGEAIIEVWKLTKIDLQAEQKAARAEYEAQQSRIRQQQREEALSRFKERRKLQENQNSSPEE